VIRRELLPEILATEDVADAFGRTSCFARRLFQRGEIPGRKIGRRWFTTREALLAHLVADVKGTQVSGGVKPQRPADRFRVLHAKEPE
jgi:hypothetical protein